MNAADPFNHPYRKHFLTIVQRIMCQTRIRSARPIGLEEAMRQASALILLNDKGETH